ncbi:serine/threonine protein kinase [Phytophthora nicotianae]|uniref:Serine/threonine protein kinase n=2 Tax=Phytophthora nicotianae TaxID=4792 RepID=V9EVT9_PHYNI|nr:serine/threonine protein kinase [Phytophthora nicotianae P1569]ETM42899.1 serine/threonine protein kinase [Phytophthora nicotianae]
MSVAPRAAPSISDRSKIQSRRGSHREEEELAVGAVVVLLSDKSDAQSAAAYRLPTGDSSHDDAKVISCATTQKDPSFVAVLAPNCDAAMASLLAQPPGTFLLVKEEDSAIAVYVKFRQAVRALTLVKGKDVKRNDDAIQLAKLRKKEQDVTPVHNLRLASDSYFMVEHCWKRFLPQVQAIVFELCCEPHVDEEIKLEDWTPSMIPPTGYSVGLMPEACGFYILTVPGNITDSTSIIQVRQVEFDFNKFAITVADGTHKPSALVLATSFSTKRAFEPDFTFSAIRDNFLTPDLVILKETTMNTIPSQQSSLQNCIDLSSTDKELAVLNAVDAACGSIMPHEPLPDSLLAVLHEMHLCFVNTTTRDETTPFSKPTQWSALKKKIVGRIIPILLELLIISATFSKTEQIEFYKSRQTLAQFARAMRFAILFMTVRSDDSVVCRLVHHLCQIFGSRIRIPAELIDFIRDLVVLFPAFLRLFLRNQGISLLWKTLRHSDVHKDAAFGSDPRGKSNSRSFRTFTSTSAANTLEGNGGRKMSLFKLARKPQGIKSRKSLSFGTNLTSTPALKSKNLAFFRLSPASVQTYLGGYLQEGFFTSPDVWKQDPVLAKIAFCSCLERREATTICARKRLGSSPKVNLYELVLQISLRFLYHKNYFANWDRDVALLLRLEEIHRHLFDEIISIVRRRGEVLDINTRDALACELRVVITCVSTLFRLERKRREEISSAVGDKKYLGFIYLFRTKIRELNESLQLNATCEDQMGESEGENAAQVQEVDDSFLNALAEVLTWIPKAFLDEWMVLCLKELLQAVNNLSNVVKQTDRSQLKQPRYVRYGYEVCKVFAVVLRRTSDPDIQVMLVRVLGTDPAIISLLRFLLSPHALSINNGREAVCMQINVLNFLIAFVNLDIVLPVQTDWESKNSQPSDEDSMNEDAEVIEQLKGELLIRLIGPRMTLEEEQKETLWEFMLELMFPASGANTVVTFNGSSRMIGMAVSFRSLSVPPSLLTNISREYFKLEEAFLRLMQALYTAQDASSPIDYDVCVASHWCRIEQYCDRIIENEGQEELEMVYRIVELNLRCLIVLASRRSQFPAIQDAFNHNRVLSCVLQRLQPKLSSLEVNFRSQCENGESLGIHTNSSIPSLPPLKLLRQPSTDTSDTPVNHVGIAKLSLLSPKSRHEQVSLDENVMLREPGLHVLAIVLVVTYIIVDPNLEIDEAICPRISVPDQPETDVNGPNELLWKLQQHLAVVDMDQRYFEVLMVEMKTLQAFVSTARLSAIRSLLRLLCPNRSSNNLYTSQDDDSREYIAKGAFSTVYRQHSAFSKSEYVAVKVVEHQRRAGELCAVSGLYNEISILSKLRGNLSATQLVDFGNYHQEQNFEIVMEYCPCSLTEWRNTIKKEDSEVPFRSCVVMILRAFEEACHCLTRVHEGGICHFDIKSDNILVRSSALELSYKLLQNYEIDKPSNNFKGWLCFADFGEAKVVDTDRIPVRTSTFSSFSSGTTSPVNHKRAEKFMSLTRTRGTEAIKSPEVLKIKGSEVAVKVTLASDIWSLGCLLYELVTQELLFQNDDWAGLYAHLVVTQDQSVLRSDHKQKVFTALNPTTSEEEAVVTKLLELCSNMLIREPTRRPKLETVTAQVRKLITDVNALPVTPTDESFMSLCQGSSKNSPIDVDFDLRSAIATLSSRKRVETHGVIVPVRLFWNFFLAAKVIKTQDTQKVKSCIGCGSGPASKDILALDAFESKFEDNFVHFVYLSWHESGDSNVHKMSQFFAEIHEEKHRTCLFLNADVTLDLHVLQQHAAQYFPVIQRCLQDEAGCVVFVALGRDDEDTKTLQGILTNILFFFLRSAVNIPAFDILRYFARDCAQFFEYPTPEFLKQLMVYSNTRVEDTEKCTMMQCRCGAALFCIETSVLAEALPTCCYLFEEEEDVYPVDSLFVYENAEEKLVLPLETRGHAVQWVVLDTVSVTRGQTPPTITSERRTSRFDILKRQSSKVEDTRAM